MTDNTWYLQLTYALRSESRPGGSVPVMVCLMMQAADTIDALRARVPGELLDAAGEDDDDAPAPAPEKKAAAKKPGGKKTPGPKCPTTGRRHKYSESHQCVCGAWERGHQPSAEARTLELPGTPVLVHRFRDASKAESRCGLPAASLAAEEITAYQAGTTCPECRA